MSQVRNLRAMFEQKAPDTSPPERGRSPALSTGGTESPRPLSRVQTSFVAIEKDGRIGLQREVSGESSVSRRRTSIDTEAESTVTSQDKPSVAAEEPAKPVKANVVTETIPESPLKDSPVNGAPPKKLQPAVGVPSSAPPEKPVEAVRAAPQPKAAEATQPKAAETKQAPVSTNLEAKPKVNGTSGTVKAAQTEPAKEPATAASKKTISQKPSKVGLSISSTASKPTTKSPSVKTPTLKTPTSPLKASQKLPTKTPEKSATPVASRTPRQPVSTTKSAPSSTQKVKPAPVQISPAHDRGIGFVKPKPKSPTRPVRLPASLMAQTASSGSKLKDPSRESLSRMSGSVSTVQSLGRSPSRGGDLSTGGQTLKRQKSTISRPRPSIGPPPKKPAQDHPVTKREREVDEGFLARMMRPTQSSSCKTAEKPPITPPRKVAAMKKPAAKDGDASARKEAAAKTTPGVVKKQVAQSNGTGSANPAEKQSSHQEEAAERQTTPIPDNRAESPLEKETIKTPEKADQKALEGLVTPLKDLSLEPEKELSAVDNTTADDMKDFSSTADTVTEVEATEAADKEDAKPEELVV